jgi:transcriptional regulator with XRE-family HTH domain
MVKFLGYIAANVRNLRKIKGWSQEQLAEHAGLSTRFVQDTEASRANISVASLVALAEALAVEPPSLFKPTSTLQRRVGRPPRNPAGTPEHDRRLAYETKPKASLHQLNENVVLPKRRPRKA